MCAWEQEPRIHGGSKLDMKKSIIRCRKIELSNELPISSFPVATTCAKSRKYRTSLFSDYTGIPVALSMWLGQELRVLQHFIITISMCKNWDMCIPQSLSGNISKHFQIILIILRYFGWTIKQRPVLLGRTELVMMHSSPPFDTQSDIHQSLCQQNPFRQSAKEDTVLLLKSDGDDSTMAWSTSSMYGT